MVTPASASAGDAETALARKLGIVRGARVALVRAPDGFEATLGELRAARISRRLSGRFDVIVAFATARAELVRGLPRWRAALEPAGGLWVAWPKRASGVATDLGDAAVRELGLSCGLVDNKVCAIDATWSGLRFVYRIADRPAPGRVST
jgi:hypothetical protein